MAVFEAVSTFWKRLLWWLPASLRWFFKDPDLQPLRLLIYLLGILTFLVWLTLHPIGCLEVQTRTAGWMLQLLGFTIVLFGLRQVQTLFGRQALLVVKRGLERRPRFRGRVINASMSQILEMPASSVRGRVGVAPGTTAEQRIERLEGLYDRLYDVVGEIDDKHERRSAEVRQAVETERGERAAGDEKLAERLDEALAGGVHLSMFGVFLFVIGISLGTASPEIAWYLAGKASCY